MDSYAIAAAIATRLKAATPPTGKEAIKVATAELPESISVFPALLVSLPQPDYLEHTSNSTAASLTYQATLFLARHDSAARRSRLLHDWVTALYARLNGLLQLGLAYVSLATIENWAAGVVTYEGAEYDGVVFDVVVRIHEAGSYAA
jgi:hypothetical protein